MEGQDTENISGGASSANVPFQFIQEVQVKSSGIEAEHGGALGGVVNVVMKKGSNAYHGSFFRQLMRPTSWTVLRATNLRYDPIPTFTPAGDDAMRRSISRRGITSRIVQPGFTVGGPIIKDRCGSSWVLRPMYNSLARTVNFGPSTISGGIRPSGTRSSTRTTSSTSALARLDATLTQKIRVFGSWLYQYSRESGDSLADAGFDDWLAEQGLTISGTALPGSTARLQRIHMASATRPRMRLTTSALISR